MSDKFSNGLKLTAPAASQCGRTFSRWLVEWLTQIVGWSVVDAVSGNWQTYVSQGVAGVTLAYPDRFNIGAAAYNFTTSDIGGYLTITGFTGRWVGRNGIYRILRVIDTKTVVLDIGCGVHEDGLPQAATGLVWRLWWPSAAYVPTNGDVMVLGGLGTTGVGYTYHLRIAVRNTNSYFPDFQLSPFASWSVAGHAWLDLRYITSLGIDNWNNSIVNVDTVRVWAAGDTDRAVLCLRVEDDYYAWHFVYLGEIDPKDAVTDTNPCVLWSGSNRGSNSAPGADNQTLIGYGSDSSIVSGGRWLAFNNTTTVTGYAMILHVSPSSDVNWLAGTYRQWNESTRYRYYVPIICECRTAGYMELRGALRRVWASCREIDRLRATGTNGELLHVRGGILIPWNNSKVWYERG